MRPSRIGHLAVATIIATIVEGPATVQDMAAESGLTEHSVRGYVRAMRKRKAIHIVHWECDHAGRQTMPAYAFGHKPDAVRRPPRTRKQIAFDYRARKRAAMLLGIKQQRATA